MALHRARWFLVTSTALSLAACSAATGGGDGPEAAPPDAAPSTSTAPEGFPVVAAEAVEEQRWKLPGGPDWLVADGSRVWIKRDSGTVDRIAPDTGEIDLTVELGGDLCQGLGAGLGAVWACRGSDVARLDPETGEVVAVFPVGKAHSQGRLVAAFDRLWVLTGDGSTLVGLDAGSGDPLTTMPLGARGTDLAFGEAGLWVVSQLDRQVLRIDPAGSVAVRITDLDRPIAVAVNDEVWVGATRETSRIDPGTGDVEVSSPIGTGLDGSLAVAPDGVWVRSAERFLVRLDPDTAEPVAGVTADVESGGDVLVAFDTVWTSAFDDAALFRLRVDIP